MNKVKPRLAALVGHVEVFWIYIAPSCPGVSCPEGAKASATVSTGAMKGASGVRAHPGMRGFAPEIYINNVDIMSANC